MSEKKFANLEYPGIKADPNEGKTALTGPAAERLGVQLECIGEAAQLKLLSSSVLICGAGPLGARLAKQLASSGIGRVGMLGQGDLNDLSAWTQRETPWARFEPYSEIRLDRQLDDIARGFTLMVGTDVDGVLLAMEAARLAATDAVAAGSAGKYSWVAGIPKGTLCLDCLSHQIPRNPASAAGHFFPVMDWASVRICALAFDRILEAGAAEAFLDLEDAAVSPWKHERRPLSPRPACPNCRHADSRG